ncbi:MAG: DUF2069 domain-containing protein [Betaproteobacteria bacterium]
MASLPPDSAAARWHRLAVACVAALGLLEILWELYLAPVRPGGSWLALKAVPLALVWWPMSRGSQKARQVASLTLPLYVAEGLVRAITEGGRHALVAWMATALAAAAFIAVLLSFRRAASG